MLNDAVGFEKIFIAIGYTDLWRGIDGLASTIKFQFDLDPFQKHIQTAHHLQYIPARSFQPSHKVNY